MEVRFNGVREDFDYRRIVHELLQNNYRDLPNKFLFITIRLTDDPHNLYMGVGGVRVPRTWGWSPHFYELNGTITEEFLNNENLESILKGAFGHEFSHIAKGHAGGFKVSFLHLLGHIPRMEKRIEKLVEEAREKAADRETIRRGLGPELYLAKLYAETIGIPPSGYTSEGMQSLVLMKTLY
ncbi:MAG: hypothetical protein AABX34_00730 [Nanoarchaeota archaeon]